MVESIIVLVESELIRADVSVLTVVAESAAVVEPDPLQAAKHPTTKMANSLFMINTLNFDRPQVNILF
jgi:hypothetical protein